MLSCSDSFPGLILHWWSKNKRDFPWRHTKNPYLVIVSEMLLRKTTAKQVEKVYKAFIRRYPDSCSLAEADVKDLENLFAPLGMEHKRAYLFKIFAEAFERNRKAHVPPTFSDLIKLPGVGQYTANAVLSISYSKDVPMLDTNFIRVLKRLFGVKSSKARPRDDRGIWQFAEELIPKGKSREFNFAVLDFASAVCRPRDPKCSECPFAICCKYHSRKTKDK